MALMTLIWYLVRHRRAFSHAETLESQEAHAEPSLAASATPIDEPGAPTLKHPKILREFVDIKSIDLYTDEHEEDERDAEDDALRNARRKGRWGLLWRLWELIA